MLITPLFAAICGFMFIILSLNVVQHRMKTKTVLGDGGHHELEKAIRIHGNFGEYVPFTLLLLWLVEVVTGARSIVIVLGSIFIIGRVFHVSGMSDHQKNFKYRQAGVVATILVIFTCCVMLLKSYAPILTG